MLLTYKSFVPADLCFSDILEAAPEDGGSSAEHAGESRLCVIVRAASLHHSLLKITNSINTVQVTNTKINDKYSLVIKLFFFGFNVLVVFWTLGDWIRVPKQI